MNRNVNEIISKVADIELKFEFQLQTTSGLIVFQGRTGRVKQREDVYLALAGCIIDKETPIAEYTPDEEI